MQVSIRAAFRGWIWARQIGHDLWRIDLMIRAENGDFGVWVVETLDLEELGDISPHPRTEKWLVKRAGMEKMS